MMDMVEKVARAICKDSTYAGYNTETQKEIFFRNKRIYLSQARAAIEAMREPTDEMIIAGQTPPHERPTWGYLSGESAIYRWQAMIDEALK